MYMYIYIYIYLGQVDLGIQIFWGSEMEKDPHAHYTLPSVMLSVVFMYVQPVFILVNVLTKQITTS